MRVGRMMMRGTLLALVAAASLALAPRNAGAYACTVDPADNVALATLVADAREACPCDGTTRAAYRRCVRDRIAAAIRAGELQPRCRATAMRFASRSTCGSPAGAVACCSTLASGRQSCAIARSAAGCEASRGGSGRVGVTESCFDACPTPSPTPSAATPQPPTPQPPTPTVTVTPTSMETHTPAPPTPANAGPRCVCRCGPPPPDGGYAPYGCPSHHDCVVMSFEATGPADCAPLNDPPNRQCHFDPAAPVRDDLMGPYVDICTF